MLSKILSGVIFFATVFVTRDQLKTRMLAAETQKCKGADAAENEDFSLRPLRLCGELGGFADLL